MKKLLIRYLRILGWPFTWGLEARWKFYIIYTAFFGIVGGGLFVSITYNDWHPHPPWWFFVFFVLLSALSGMAFSAVMWKIFYGPVKAKRDSQERGDKRQRE